MNFISRLTILPACAAALVLLMSFASPAEATAGDGLSLHLERARVSHGADLEVHGLLAGDGRRALGRSWVRVYFRPSTSRRWHRVGKVPVSRTGRYRLSFTANRTGRLRALSSDGTGSAARRVRVRSRLTVARVAKQSKVGSRVVVRGVVRPAGRRRIKVVVRGADRSVLRTTTKRHGGFKVSFRPKSSGTHRLRVYAARNAAAGADVGRRIRVVGLRPTHASYYGPGLYGNGTACGGTLYPDTRGVAHKTLPCGTRVTLRYGRRTVVARVIDRGPYVAGREFDLTEATRNDLGFGGVGTVWTNR
jgi:hypothetical protein